MIYKHRSKQPTKSTDKNDILLIMFVVTVLGMSAGIWNNKHNKICKKENVIFGKTNCFVLVYTSSFVYMFFVVVLFFLSLLYSCLLKIDSMIE